MNKMKIVSGVVYMIIGIAALIECIKTPGFQPLTSIATGCLTGVGVGTVFEGIFKK